MFTRNALILVLVLLAESVFGQQAVKFAHYNVENYLEMNRREGGEAVLRPKPEREKATLIRIIKDIHPDILGVAEMGPPDQFDEFQQRLKDSGLEFPFTEYVSGADQERHLALLSRLPIVERHSEKDPFFDLNGQKEPVERGFLDVTIAVNPAFRLRMVGAHLKSKLVVPSGEALLRRNEARLLRRRRCPRLGHDGPQRRQRGRCRGPHAPRRSHPDQQCSQATKS